jgi:hypothetical protein
MLKTQLSTGTLSVGQGTPDRSATASPALQARKKARIDTPDSKGKWFGFSDAGFCAVRK